MENAPDLYLTLKAPTPEILFTEKKSKFFGYAFPLENEENVRPIIEEIRLKHPLANHVCYAWRLGVGEVRYRANDDGEPNNSAGTPIYGQIQSFGLTRVLVVVARIFGGTKLGIGGLGSAYRMAAQMALEAGEIVERTIAEKLHLHFDYSQMDKVMRLIKKEQLEIVFQDLKLDCSLTLSVRKSDVQRVRALFGAIPGLKITEVG